MYSHHLSIFTIVLLWCYATIMTQALLPLEREEGNSISYRHTKRYVNSSQYWIHTYLPLDSLPLVCEVCNHCVWMVCDWSILNGLRTFTNFYVPHHMGLSVCLPLCVCVYVCVHVCVSGFVCQCVYICVSVCVAIYQQQCEWFDEMINYTAA